MLASVDYRSPSDEVLLALAQSGDPAAYEQFFDRFNSLLRTVAWQRCRGRYHQVEDAVQETYRQVFDPNVVRFDPAGNARHYLIGLAWNACKIVMRQSATIRGFVAAPPSEWGTAVAALPSSEQSEERVDSADAVQYILTKCDKEVQQVVRRCGLDSATICDVSAELRMSRFRVGRIWRRFLADARRWLEYAQPA